LSRHHARSFPSPSGFFWNALEVGKWKLMCPLSIFPVGLPLAYFMIATVFEFPYASIRSGISGIAPFALMWYQKIP